MNQIVAVLVSKELITDLMTPQAAYSQEKIKDTIGDIAQSSIMRLDATSMDKLWDLVTTVFKWQLTLSSDILKITQRHVSELEDYVTNGEILLQLRKVQNIVDNFGQILTAEELTTLRDEILEWLSYSSIKVSLLLKLGLQNVDGSFVTENRSDLMKEILGNLGQNIYALSQTNNNYNRGAQTKKQDKVDNCTEVDLLVNQLGGEQKFGTDSPRRNRLRLNIGDCNRNCVRRTAARGNYQSFDIERRNGRLDDLLSELNIADDNFTNDDVDFKDDLLKLMDSNA